MNVARGSRRSGRTSSRSPRPTAGARSTASPSTCSARYYESLRTTRPVLEVGRRQALVRAGGDAPGGGGPCDPARAGRGPGRSARGRLPEQPQRQPAPEPARRVLREPDHLQAGQAAGRRPGQPRRLGARLDHRRRRLRRRQPGGDRLVHQDRHADLGRQPDRLRRRGDLDLHRAAAPPSRRRSAPRTAPSIDGFDIRGGDQQGFPGNINVIGGGPTGAPRRPDHPGRRDLRQRLCPQPADHQQRGPEQRRRLRHDPHRDAGPAGPRHRATTTTTSGSPTTGSSPTPAPTWRAASASSPARRLRRSPATTSAATSRPSTAAASAVYGLSPNGVDPPQPDLLQPVVRRGRRDHDRRPAAGRSVDPLAGLAAPSTSTTT